MWLDGNLCNKYIRTPPTHYFIKSSGQTDCMETILTMTTTKHGSKISIEHYFDAKEMLWSMIKYIYMALCNSIYDDPY